MRKKYIFWSLSSLALLLLLPWSGMAQGKIALTVKGIVKDETGSPMIGVNLQLKGTTLASITDIDGNYTLSGTVPSEGEYSLVTSYIGYSNSTQSIQVSARQKTI